jgi:hypothetical protein
MAAVFISNILVQRAASQGASSAVRCPGARRPAYVIAASISHMAVRAGELALFCWAVVTLAFSVSIMAAFFL